MLGSPSFHSYRDARTGSGRPDLELGSGIYYEDPAYTVRVGQNWTARAPVRRAILPAKRSINSDDHSTSSSGIESLSCSKSTLNDMDDRVHNALLEELCSDFGVTDSSYVDFLNFDIPADQVQSVQLPADLEELGEIVSFDTVRLNTEPVTDVSKHIHRTGSISGQGSFYRSGVTTVKTSSGMQMRIPDDVASPTISSSCEESKPIEGGREGLSDFPPTVHSTTGGASTKLDIDATSDKGDDNLKRSSTKKDSVVETEQTQLLGEKDSSVISPTKNQPERSDSTASSPVHVAKKPRIIASGGDLLEEVKKSYAFVCGADMFLAPTQPAMSHPRLQAPVGSQNMMNDMTSYSRSAAGARMSVADGGESLFGSQNMMNDMTSYSRSAAGARMSVADGGESLFQYGMQHLSVDQSANFHNLTPGPGFCQRYDNEWQASPASVNRLSTDLRGSGSDDFHPHSTQHIQHHDTAAATVLDIRGPVPYTDSMPYPRAAEFSSHVDPDRLNYPSVNRSPRFYQVGRSHGYSMGTYGGSYQPISRHPGSQQHELYRNPHASPYHSQPSSATNAVRQGSVVTDDCRGMHPTGYQYPASRGNMVANANYTQRGNYSSAPSLVRPSGRSVTPGLVSLNPLQPGAENYVQDSNAGNLHYAGNNPATPTSRLPLMKESISQPVLGVEKNMDLNSASMKNECTFSRTGTASNLYSERRGNFCRSPASDRFTVNQMTPRRGRMPLYAPSDSSLSGQAADSGCHRFVRHLIGSGSGPYRSHPLFPLLRDLVIADMNFEAPSFPYPLIAGLPKSFNRLISNYFSCTSSHSANTANLDPSLDPVVMDALRYAHSALLDKIHQRQLKESHQASVPVSPVDSVCSHITQIGPLNNQERLQASWTDLSQSGSNTSRCMSDQQATNCTAPPSAGSESVPCSPRQLSSRFQAMDDSPAGKPHYTLSSSPSAVYHGHEESSPQMSYFQTYAYGDMPLEKVSRSKVLPNEAKAIMTEWLRNHQDNPYPNDDEKEALMQSTKLTINQINYWFTNARRRLLPKWSMLRRNAEEAKNRCGSPIMTL